MTKKASESAQILLMNKLKQAIPPSMSLVDILSDLFKVSTDSAYRRIRGETALSIEEIALLCKHFKISFDAFINSSENGMVTFSYKQLNSDITSYKNYLQNISNDLAKIASFPEKQIIYAAEDVPLFHHFAFPNLTAFKIFYWNKSILNVTEFENKKYEMSLIDPELIEISKTIIERYSLIPSIEIWSDDTVNSTIKQIEFYWDSGIFKNKEDALLICHEVELMLNRIKKQAEENVKFDNNNKPASSTDNYALYHSDVMIGNNCILVTMGGVKAAYLSYHTFNAMTTTNTFFTNETDAWLKNLIRKSNLISGVAEKQRYRYFKHIDNALNKLKHKIESE